MATIIILALLITYLCAAVAAIRDPKPQRRPPEWSVGALIGHRH